MDRTYRVLDSRFVARVGNARTLAGMIGLGAALVLALGLTAVGVARVGGVLVVAAFAVWTAVSLLGLWAWTNRRLPSSIASPRQWTRAVKGGVDALADVLSASERESRRLTAEAAILVPVNNHAAAFALGEQSRALELQVGKLLRTQKSLDERWLLLWMRQPRSTEDGRLFQPLTVSDMNHLSAHMARRTRQLRSMIGFLESGDDDAVRHVHAWLNADRRGGETGAQRGAQDVGNRSKRPPQAA